MRNFISIFILLHYIHFLCCCVVTSFCMLRIWFSIFNHCNYFYPLLLVFHFSGNITIGLLMHFKHQQVFPIVAFFCSPLCRCANLLSHIVSSASEIRIQWYFRHKVLRAHNHCERSRLDHFGIVPIGYSECRTRKPMMKLTIMNWIRCYLLNSDSGRELVQSTSFPSNSHFFLSKSNTIDLSRYFMI